MGYHPTIYALDISKKGAARTATLRLEHLKKTWTRMAERLQTPKKAAEPQFKIGNKVFLKTDHLKSTRPSKKLDAKKIGPFRIVRNIKGQVYELDLPKGMRIHQAFNTHLLTPCPRDIPLQKEPTPVEADKEYEVETILGKKMISNTDYYLVKWKGYPPSENT